MRRRRNLASFVCCKFVNSKRTGHGPNNHRAAVSIPAVAAASVSHSADVGGSVVGVVGLL